MKDVTRIAALEHDDPGALAADLDEACGPDADAVGRRPIARRQVREGELPRPPRTRAGLLIAGPVTGPSGGIVDIDVPPDRAVGFRPTAASAIFATRLS